MGYSKEGWQASQLADHRAGEAAPANEVTAILTKRIQELGGKADLFIARIVQVNDYVLWRIP